MRTAGRSMRRNTINEAASLHRKGEMSHHQKSILVDRDAELLIELRQYLDAQVITGDTIGDIRRSLFVPWNSQWNGWVRDETAAREKPASNGGLDARLATLLASSGTED